MNFQKNQNIVSLQPKIMTYLTSSRGPLKVIIVGITSIMPSLTATFVLIVNINRTSSADITTGPTSSLIFGIGYILAVIDTTYLSICTAQWTARVGRNGLIGIGTHAAAAPLPRKNSLGTIHKCKVYTRPSQG